MTNDERNSLDALRTEVREGFEKVYARIDSLEKTRDIQVGIWRAIAATAGIASFVTYIAVNALKLHMP